MSKKIFVTTSLPYANGDLHVGHLLEHVQADIWVRYQRAIGNQCLFISGNDAHGSAIMLSAEKQSMTPEAWVDKVSAEHRRDIEDFGISFDVFHTTRSPENQALVYRLYDTIKTHGGFAVQSVSQPYDVEKSMFLPDRFVKGICPKCHAKDQYGDNCEVCGATYEPMELIDPYSVLSHTTPEVRDSDHVFFKLAAMQSKLKAWMDSVDLQDAVRNKLLEWFQSGLKNWDISRDAPYFGFTIPGYEDKYFYVWMDAPVGYLAALRYYDVQNKTQYLEEIWLDHSSAWEIHHFIGKDIMYFHGLFWPAVLKAADFRTPTSLHAHGFLTLNGAKMSKSRGSFVTIRQYLDRFSPEYIRYYFASKLGSGVADMDLNWEDFTRRCNADLVGKIVNVGSRSCGFLHKYFQGKLADSLDEGDRLKIFFDKKTAIMGFYEDKNFAKVVREIAALADLANQYVDEKKPWSLAKDPSQLALVHRIVTTTMHMFRLIMLYLKPILPETTEKVALLFMQDDLDWAHHDRLLLSQAVNPFPRLLERVRLEDCP
ncbi:MAG: methionine--tRNA ligase [Pseudomonadota bacterium]|nr:methionine--tRNA ligase [Pseudomonadota bacterium]